MNAFEHDCTFSRDEGWGKGIKYTHSNEVQTCRSELLRLGDVYNPTFDFASILTLLCAAEANFKYWSYRKSNGQMPDLSPFLRYWCAFVLWSVLCDGSMLWTCECTCGTLLVVQMLRNLPCDTYPMVPLPSCWRCGTEVAVLTLWYYCCCTEVVILILRCRL